MNKLFSCFTLMTVLLIQTPAHAQSEEIQQLILDLEKLNQFRAILNDMYKGYTILAEGYNTVKDLSQGNFNLHKVFLDGLLAVSPTVQKYKRVFDIIECQQEIVKQYKSARNRFESSGVFSTNDLEYLQSVYNNLFDRSLKNLDELLMVITDNQLRMNDAERLKAIDRIYQDIQDKLNFLRHFNDNTRLLAQQKIKDQQDTKRLREIYGIK